MIAKIGIEEKACTGGQHLFTGFFQCSISHVDKQKKALERIREPNATLKKQALDFRTGDRKNCSSALWLHLRT
jgi:hypothetical protein